MIIKCYGSRGSLPVSGKQFLKYGGDTTCLMIRAKSGDIIIIDAGSGIRKLGNELLNEDINVFHVLFTHLHWDHVMGFPFFKPLYFKKNTVIIHKCYFDIKILEKSVNAIMKPPNFPIKLNEMAAEVKFERDMKPVPFDIGSVHIEPITLSHPNYGMGYKLTEEGKSFVFLTDNELDHKHPGGHETRVYEQFVKDADMLFHDAQYTASDYHITHGWGHSEYIKVVDMAISAGVVRLGLFHHNPDRTDAEIDEILTQLGLYIKNKGVVLRCFGVCGDMEYRI